MELVKQTEEGDVSNYQANGEFDLVSFSSIKNIEFYSCCPEPYPDITYTIQLRRRPLFYVFNLILPCILINGIGNEYFKKIFLYTFHPVRIERCCTTNEIFVKIFGLTIKTDDLFYLNHFNVAEDISRRTFYFEYS